MYEIELKAHVTDAPRVRTALSSFAEPLGVTEKDDTYYRMNTPLGGDASGGRPYLTCRIRRQVQHGLDGETLSQTIFTYKRKSLVKGTHSIEVNDEKECLLDNAQALEAMLLDAHFTVSHKKHKRAEGFACSTPCGQAHIELCDVPPLGDFLEIEIMSEAHDDEAVSNAREAIMEIFAKCSIPSKAIEERYYTQMLEDVSEK